jgi:hypothetical protein
VADEVHRWEKGEPNRELKTERQENEASIEAVMAPRKGNDA